MGITMIKQKPFTMRLEDDTECRLKKIAKKYHYPMRTMLRSWIIERLEWEEQN